MKNPVYQNGQLCCGECGKPMVCSDTRFGDSTASCNDTGCPQGQKAFESGSIRHNPAIPLTRKNFNYNSSGRYVFGAANFIVKDGVKVG